MLNSLDEETADRLLHILWEDSITGLALVREDGTFWRVNPAFCRITEFTEAELKRRRFQDITVPGDVPPDEEMAKLVVDGFYETYDMTKEYITKTKKIQQVFLRVTGLRRKDGMFMYFVAEAAPLDRTSEERTDQEIKGAAVRRLLMKRLRENLPLIVMALSGLGILIGYATGGLSHLPGH